MVVKHTLYSPFMKNIANGNITDLESTTILVSLMATAGFSFTQANEYWATVSGAKSTYASYPSSGVVLGGTALASSGRVTILTATSETQFCSSGTISSPFAVLHVSSYLVSCVDFDGVESSVDGEFKITWTDDKVLTMTVAT